MQKVVPFYEKKRVAEFVRPNARLRFPATQLGSLTARSCLFVRISEISRVSSCRRRG